MELDTISERLSFNKLDQATVALLRENSDKILTILPVVLDGFYLHVAQFPETNAFFRDEAHMRHAKEKQLQHWQLIVEGNFDERYVASVTRIGEIHNQLDLNPRWYIGGYNFLITGVVDAISRSMPTGRFAEKKRERLRQLQNAIIRAAMLDMDFAIEVYLKAGIRDRHETLERLATEFETSVGEVVGAVSIAAQELTGASRSLHAGAEGTSHKITTVASSSEETAVNVQTVASATEEMASSVTEIARQVSDSTNLSSKAVEGALETNEKVRSLTSAAQVIGDVVGLISDIAEKTNLLALNATIEAARAGDAGKGFAVVASEVKQLAEQTAKATAEIENQVGAIQDATTDAAASIETISGIIEEMNAISTTVASAIEEQEAATQEIARNIDEAARGTQLLSQNISGVNEAAEMTGTASAQIMSSAEALAGQSAYLKTEVDRFLGSVRSA
jgi:methyl-accepting chemotaxis protein